ncbi:MAG: diguanylate cyclase [Betaproteobacteria bacterium]|nr:diguanylate cyclase [Betaproteobacteria bacterium]
MAGAVLFAAIWGVVIAYIAAALLRGHNPWPIGAAVMLTAFCAVLGALIPLSLARRMVQHLFADLRVAVQQSDRSGGALASLPTGWADFDALTAEMDRLARLRALRIEALTRQEARFRALADSAHGVEAWFSRNGSLVWISRSIEQLTGYTRAECLLGSNLIELLVAPKDRRQVLTLTAGALRGESGKDVELRIQCKDGSQRWIACHWRSLFGPDNRLLGLRVSIEDIEVRKDAEMRLLDTVASLRRAQALQDHYLQRSDDERLRLVALLDTLRVGILFVDQDRRVYYCNRAMRIMCGIGLDENINGLRDEALVERTRALRSDDTAYCLHFDAIQSKRTPSAPYEIPFTDGRLLEEVSGLVISEDGQRDLGRVWIYEDVTERKRIAKQLLEHAERDPLTNLLNRRRFHEELNRMIAESTRRHDRVGLLTFDLDGFKGINDQFGHSAGDHVLTTVATSVGAIVRRNELFFRLGGDEFAILIPEAALENVVTLARRINTCISSTEFEFPEGTGRVGASLGIALYPDHAASAEMLIECADTAMYGAKSAGKNRVEIFNRQLH